MTKTKTNLPEIQEELKKLFELPLFSTQKMAPMLPGMDTEPVMAFVSEKTDTSAVFSFTYFGIAIQKATLLLIKGKYVWKI